MNTELYKDILFVCKHKPAMQSQPFVITAFSNAHYLVSYDGKDFVLSTKEEALYLCKGDNKYAEVFDKIFDTYNLANEHEVLQWCHEHMIKFQLVVTKDMFQRQNM